MLMLADEGTGQHPPCSKAQTVVENDLQCPCLSKSKRAVQDLLVAMYNMLR